MNITKENVDELNATLKIQVAEEDYSGRVDEVLKDYRKKVRLDGFRPGKVPAGMVRRMYRTTVLVEEVNKLISESLSNYIREQNLKILGEPLPSRTQDREIDWEHQTEFEFDFDLGLAPELEISLSQKDRIPYYEIQIDKQMIEETKDSYAGRMGRMDPVDHMYGRKGIQFSI